jgi:hypothetical protein
MCTGDFNGNFIPSGLKGGTANLELNYLATIKVGPNESFYLPLRAGKEMSVGAISLILSIPNDLVEVEDVVVNGSSDPVSFNPNGNELRIGWNSVTPVYALPGSDLVILKLRTTNSFAEGRTIRIALANDPLNELADASMKAIPDAVLNLDLVEFGTTGIIETPATAMNLSSYPNPFSDFTTISYSLPVDGRVTLEVENLLGVTVKTLINETQTRGRYELKLSGRDLPDGVYTAILHLNGPEKEFRSVIKFVVNK